MRKKAQEEKTKNKATAASSPSSSSSASATTTATATSSSASAATTVTEAEEEATTSASASEEKKEVPPYCAVVEMDQLWNEIAAAEIYPDMMMSWGGSGHVAVPAVEPSSPAWEFCADYSLWRIDDEEYYNTIDQHALN